MTARRKEGWRTEIGEAMAQEWAEHDTRRRRRLGTRTKGYFRGERILHKGNQVNYKIAENNVLNFLPTPGCSTCAELYMLATVRINLIIFWMLSLRRAAGRWNKKEPVQTCCTNTSCETTNNQATLCEGLGLQAILLILSKILLQ
jgi:hypothetical protein